jgi:hypothetical protein
MRILSGGRNVGKRSNTERGVKKSGMGTDQEHQSPRPLRAFFERGPDFLVLE